MALDRHRLPNVAFIIALVSLAVLSIATSAAHGSGDQTPARTALTGKMVYYSSSAMKFMLLDLATRATNTLAMDPNAHQPALSPDAKLVAFIDGRERLHVQRVADGKEVAVFAEERCSYASPVFLSNETLAYVKEDRKGQGIYLSPADRVGERAWGRQWPEDYTPFPAISPVPGSGEEYPTFVLAGRKGLFLLSTAGAKLLFTNEDGDRARYPAVSPSGKTVAFYRDIPGGIWALELSATGGVSRQLTPKGDDGSWPTWSPDGKYLAYLSTAAATRGLSVVDSSGREVSRTGGGFLMAVGILRVDGTADGAETLPLLDAEGKPLHTHGDNVAWR